MELDRKAADFLRLAAELIADQSARIAKLSDDLAAARAELHQAQCHQARAAACCPGPLPGIEPGKVLGAYPGPDLTPLFDFDRPAPIPGGPMLHATRPAGNGGR